MLDVPEFIDLRVMLFYVVLNEHVGDTFTFVPVIVAQLVEDVVMVTVDGIVIFIFPAEVKGSIKLTEKE